MPITRTRLPGEPDENGDLPHAVFGTDGPEVYRTQGGDMEVSLLGGNDRLIVDRAYQTEYFELLARLGPGNDLVPARAMGSGVWIEGEDGNDRIAVGAGDGSSGAQGGPGNDVLRSLGGDEGNWLRGGEGSDQLYSSADRDHLFGGPGVDRFYLNDDGDDTVHFLTGHTGTAASAGKPDQRDVIFNFDPEPGDPRNGDDWITDQDRIDLSVMDADPAAEGDQAFAWIGSTAKAPLGMGQVGYFVEGEHAVVAWINAGGRQAVVLNGLADQAGQLGAGDFWL